MAEELAALRAELREEAMLMVRCLSDARRELTGFQHELGEARRQLGNLTASVAASVAASVTASVAGSMKASMGASVQASLAPSQSSPPPQQALPAPPALPALPTTAAAGLHEAAAPWVPFSMQEEEVVVEEEVWGAAEPSRITKRVEAAEDVVARARAMMAAAERAQMSDAGRQAVRPPATAAPAMPAAAAAGHIPLVP